MALLLFGVGLPSALPGCSATKVLSALEVSGAKVLEAQAALDLIGSRLDELAQVPAVASTPAFQKARAALTQARLFLHAASQALQEAQSAAATTDPAIAMAAFSDAWKALDAALAVLELVGDKPGATVPGEAPQRFRALRVPAPAAAR